MSQPYQPGEHYWHLVDPYWLSLNESWDGQPSALLGALRSVPSKAKHLYACHWCQSEVLNGGFYQFFYNTTGILAPEAVEGFYAVGAPELAEIVAEAMANLGRDFPRDRNVRLSVLPRTQGEAFAGIDAKFNAWIDAKRNRWELLADIYATGP
jgi:hypothetical protein